MKCFAVAVLAGILLAGPAFAAPIQVYYNDFDGGQTFASGVTGGLSGITSTAGVQGFSALGFSGNFLHNTTLGAATVLTLNNLPSHDRVDIDFLLALIDSWDGDNSSWGPDSFNVSIDGTPVLQLLLTYGGAQLGSVAPYGFSSWSDRAFDMGPEAALSLAHSASTLTLELFASGPGWQGGSDESWAIENLSITVNSATAAVPEPSTLALMGLGLLGLVAARRRKV